MDFRETLNQRVISLAAEEQKAISNYNVLIGQLREARQVLANFDAVKIEKDEANKKKVETTVKATTSKPVVKKTTTKTVTKVKKAS